jgi:hypothetical protein
MTENRNIVKVYLSRIDVENVNGLTLTKDLIDELIKQDKQLFSEFHYKKVTSAHKATNIDLQNVCFLLSGLHLVGDRLYATAELFGPKSTIIDFQELKNYPERRFFSARSLVRPNREVAKVVTWDFLGMRKPPHYIDEIQIKPEFLSRC